MPSDDKISQDKIDAQVSGGPQKPSSPPVHSDAAPAPSEYSLSPTESESLPARLARLESDFATVKRELQGILTDLREKLMEAENPFKASVSLSQPQVNPPRTETKGK